MSDEQKREEINLDDINNEMENIKDYLYNIDETLELTQKGVHGIYRTLQYISGFLFIIIILMYLG